MSQPWIRRHAEPGRPAFDLWTSGRRRLVARRATTDLPGLDNAEAHATTRSASAPRVRRSLRRAKAGRTFRQPSPAASSPLASSADIELGCPSVTEDIDEPKSRTPKAWRYRLARYLGG